MKLFINKLMTSTSIPRSPEDGAGGGAGGANGSEAAGAEAAASTEAFTVDGEEAAGGGGEQEAGKEANADASTDADASDTFTADDADENQESDADDAGSEQEGDDEGAPEEYAAFDLPEGFEGLSEEALGNFTAVAKSKDMSQEEAQGLIDLHVSELQRQLGEAQQSQAKAWEDQTAGFSKASRKEGLLEPAVLSQANAGLKAADPTGELGFLLQTLGLNKHQGVIRAFSKYGEVTSNDRTVPSSGQTGTNAGTLGQQFENAFKSS
jgi:hypothetical protein